MKPLKVNKNSKNIALNRLVDVSVKRTGNKIKTKFGKHVENCCHDQW